MIQQEKKQVVFLQRGGGGSRKSNSHMLEIYKIPMANIEVLDQLDTT